MEMQMCCTKLWVSDVCLRTAKVAGVCSEFIIMLYCWSASAAELLVGSNKKHWITIVQRYMAPTYLYAWERSASIVLFLERCSSTLCVCCYWKSSFCFMRHNAFHFRKSLLGRKKSSEGNKPSETSSASKTASDNRDDDGDDDMKELLSQYMDQGKWGQLCRP